MTPNERNRADELQAEFAERVSIVPDNLSLTSVSAIIKYLDILISPDTSLVHIARSCRVPVVGLYSRFMKNFMLWRPYDQEEGAVVSSNDHNIYDIEPEQIVETFNKLIKTERKSV